MHLATPTKASDMQKDHGNTLPSRAIGVMGLHLPPFSRPAEAARMLAIGESSLWAKAKHDPGFPRALKLGARTTVFKTAELLAWAEARANGEVAK